MSVTPSQFHLISKLMDASAIRQRVVGQNIANVNTPGYTAREVDFESQLAEQLRAGSEPGDVVPQIRLSEGAAVRSDGNNVDIDHEIGQLNKNGMLYHTYVQVLTTKISQMRSAITGR